MKLHTIKKLNGQKTLLVNVVEKSNILDLFVQSKKQGLDFAFKTENGYTLLGVSLVASFLGINDVSDLLRLINN